MIIAEDNRTCDNCKYELRSFNDQPCSGCKNMSVTGSEEYNARPFLWEANGVAEDAVNHPKHYETGKFECIEVMCEAIGLEDTKGFCLCNAFKYIYRCTKKHNTPVEDVKKAIWYLGKFLELEGEVNE